MALRGRSTRLAWTLGAAGVAGCVVAAYVVVVLGAPASLLPIYVVGILMGGLGAMVASRQPRNSVGWLMCATSLGTALVHLIVGYAYFAVVVERGSWPLGSFAVWLGSWYWPVVLVFLPLISVRFPDGRVPRGWRPVDWLAIAGVAGFAGAIALHRGAGLVDFMPLPGSKASALVPYTSNPLAVFPSWLLITVQGGGLLLLLVAYAGSAASLVVRFRRATGDVRQQLKWFAYSGALVAATFIYGGIAWNFFGQPLYLALTPFVFAALTLPIALGIAILGYRLYDIDLLINRTLVYASLTAILGALYAAVVTFLNRLFVSISGQKTDAGYVVTAFVVAFAFGPVKDWLQRQVDRRVGHANPEQLLEQFRAGVDAVVTVIDVDRVVRALVDRSVVAFDARGGAVYLASNGDSDPVYSRGLVDGRSDVEVLLSHEKEVVGRLVMGGRRGDLDYSERDRLALQRSADSVAEAVALAAELGRVPAR